jgi:hypothetical protein
VALQLPDAGTPTFIDQVLTQQEYDTALAAARAGRCDRSFKFERSNGHVGERMVAVGCSSQQWLARVCLSAGWRHAGYVDKVMAKRESLLRSG